jgi:hypothetical protein
MNISEPAAFQQAFAHALADDAAAIAMFADPAMARALAVHRNTSAKAAQDALAANFPVLRTLVGEDSFEGCAKVFVEIYPPRDPRLCLYGEGLAAFIAGYGPFSQAPYLTEVAALERLVTEALFAADAEPLDGAGFARALDLDLALPLHPAVRFTSVASPAASIWFAHQPGAPPDALERLAWGEEALLVSRPGMAVQVAIIDSSALVFLKACQSGATVTGAALAAAALGADVSALVATLITAGAFRAGLD